MSLKSLAVLRARTLSKPVMKLCAGLLASLTLAACSGSHDDNNQSCGKAPHGSLMSSIGRGAGMVGGLAGGLIGGGVGSGLGMGMRGLSGLSGYGGGMGGGGMGGGGMGAPDDAGGGQYADASNGAGPPRRRPQPCANAAAGKAGAAPPSSSKTIVPDHAPSEAIDPSQIRFEEGAS
ncbi:hypothetical protein AA23498_1247 [Acetobacter nitrogenifigens DSM 23921 = NBRC 105050]|uniref:Glycine-zipper-containing OmpA-like membrane domain-containing protein n=1 Tax=Acetobacter nitrogenifigens DSM 23921 = NBRC 105050 TaxID=1120919 RepID=A0A511XCX6_9PROT|nr:hypothetical protein [Acetobacter nitrogenifigens]GBQ91672.1 hypothetical protein AA23498_1247 [Acetobacter nitrogenifigens DSM 23921 = NBRC 105050]GEN60802.1 hypothetical protein ANI02nite_26860 [Acetobacter nitrogenifigens DSM 23921 = NBRC 105050]